MYLKSRFIKNIFWYYFLPNQKYQLITRPLIANSVTITILTIINPLI